ncbi:MAG TPA: hypothetical protein VGM50_13715 [Gemmatimonadaceae bacterium]|jgi:hypothetical protein
MANEIKRSAETWAYVLQGDRALPPEQQTRFTLRPMTVLERAAAQDDLIRSFTNETGQRVLIRRTRQQTVAIALEHITAIENFPVGAPALWPSDRTARIAYLERLVDTDVDEIGNEVWRRSLESFAAGTPAGNSLPPALTSGSGEPSAANTSTTVSPVNNGPT